MPDVTINQALALLGIHHTTLKKWCRELGIEPTRHKRDGRYWMLTTEQVAAIRQARAEMPQSRPSQMGNEQGNEHAAFLPPHTTARPPYPVRRSSSTPTPAKPSESHGALQGHMAVGSRAPALPDGWIAVSTLARTFNLSQQTMDRAEVKGEIPAPHRGTWWTGKQHAKLVYDGTQAAAVLAWARERWPEKFATLAELAPSAPARESVPTVRRSAIAAETSPAS